LRWCSLRVFCTTNDENTPTMIMPINIPTYTAGTEKRNWVNNHHIRIIPTMNYFDESIYIGPGEI